MKLNYRGVQYDYNPQPIDLTNLQAQPSDLTYRGVAYTSNPQGVGVLNSNPTTAELTYRFNTYKTNQPVAAPVGETADVAAIAPTSAKERARVLMMNHHRAVKRRQQTMLTRLAATIGMDVETASHYWNHVQGKVHPSFWATYDRSHVAAS